MQIEKSWLTPGSRHFGVLGDDSRGYLLEYQEKRDIWYLLTVNKP